jgi:hypothetical protein
MRPSADSETRASSLAICCGHCLRMHLRSRTDAQRSNEVLLCDLCVEKLRPASTRAQAEIVERSKVTTAVSRRARWCGGEERMPREVDGGLGGVAAARESIKRQLCQHSTKAQRRRSLDGSNCRTDRCTPWRDRPDQPWRCCRCCRCCCWSWSWNC